GVLIHRFDRVESFPLLDSFTTAGANASVALDTHETLTILRVSWQRQPQDPDTVRVVLAMPPRAIEGRGGRFVLAIVGDASGASIGLDAADAGSGGFAYELGRVNRAGPCSLEVNVDPPTRWWASREQDQRSGVLWPVTPHRLCIELPRICQACTIGLTSLHISGEVFLVPSGLAEGPMARKTE
ncbi:MAG: hypothetical protein ACE5EX_08490, partial [Phycisphaerae bacterium]